MFTIVGDMVYQPSHESLLDGCFMFFVCLLLLFRNGFHQFAILTAHFEGTNCTASRDRKQIFGSTDWVIQVLPKLLLNYHGGGYWSGKVLAVLEDVKNVLGHRQQRPQ
jgi:hypothetical protein